MAHPPSVETLVIVSHVVHYRHGGQLAAYGPYAREIDIWADLFPHVIIAAPCRHAEPPGDCVPFTRPNITIDPQTEAGGDTWAAKARLAVALPSLVIGLSRSLARADAIHVRCPGNLGLIGIALAPLFSDRLVAKYAGQWDGFAGEPWTGRLERYLLRSRWWCGPVTVYGEWPDQPHHIVPFFTSMMTARQVGHAAAIAEDKRLGIPLRVLYSGMLETRKRVDALLDAAAIATARGVRLELAIVGDGPERQSLARRAAESGVSHLVRFAGALPFERALEWYEWAHCLVLPSRHSEGWPKVVAEAMTHGVMCIAVAHGQVPAMLEGRGILVAHGSPVEFADALGAVAEDPDAFRSITAAGCRWACQYSLEGLRDAIASLLTERWQMPVRLARDRAEVSA